MENGGLPKSLPTKENIMLRIGSCDSNCVLCGDAVESSIHYSSNILQLGQSNMRAVGDQGLKIFQSLLMRTS